MAISIRDASVYTDLSGLQSISQLGRENSSEALREVATQFEAMFLNIMLKGMRAGEETLFADNYLRSSEMNFHRENLDNQLALHMANAGGTGLAEVLHRQLMQRYEPAASSQPAAADTLKLNNTRRLQDRVAALSMRDTALGSAPSAAFSTTPSPAPAPVAVQVPAPVREPAPAQFESADAFVRHLLPVAQKFAAELGVDARVLLAQSALETGWGQKMIRGADGSASHNLFGIKAGPSWQGERVSVSTLEFRDGVMQRETASFRAYGSYEESFADYVRLMQNQPRYSVALRYAGDAAAYTEQLQLAGYATDPDYAEKIQSVMRSPSLSAWIN